MQTVEFKPDENAILRRKNIKPFGNNQKGTAIRTPIEFVIDKEAVVVEEMPSQKYTAMLSTPTQNSSRFSSTVSVRVSNFPLNMERNELVDIIKAHTNVRWHRINLVKDRESGESRGFAFVVVDNREDAMQLIKDLRRVVVDRLVMAAELARN